jgi:hypothetical protein
VTVILGELSSSGGLTVMEGVRGKYFDRFQTGTNLVLLEPDVARAFPTAESVKEALKMLMRVAESSSKPPAA